MIVIISSLSSADNLYNILGVNKHASSQNIRQAYKHLVKIWHPEKNKDPSAVFKFTRINEAYQTLGDPERRSIYDQHGYTASHEIYLQRNNPRYHKTASHISRVFSFGAESIIDKHMITHQFYDVRILPESFRRPYFLYAYGDTCYTCRQIEPLLEKFIKELEELGIGVGTIHVTSNRVLGSNLRIHEIPQIMAVVNARVTYFKGQVTKQALRDFVRNLFEPSKTLKILNDNNFQSFLLGWSDNRMRALFFTPKEKPSLRFLMSAFAHREKIASGYIHTRSPTVQTILSQFNVNKAKESLLMIGEDSNTSVAIITTNTLSLDNINQVMNANQYLTLPRLSSQIFFDELCPIEIRPKRRKLCVILVSKKTEEHNTHRAQFRNYVERAPTFENKVKFMYLYEETQHRFVSALMKGNETVSNPSTLKLAILWRMDKRHMNYEWVEPGWSGDHIHNQITSTNLEKRLEQLFTNSNILHYTATLPDFHNEHTLSLMVRIVHRMFDWVHRLVTHFRNYDFMTWVSMLVAVVSVFLVGLLMRWMLNTEMEKVKKQHQKIIRRPTFVKNKRLALKGPNDTMVLYELCPGNYSMLVEDADPGFTIILLLAEEAKEYLLGSFRRLMDEYTHSKVLTFSYLDLNKYLTWYRQLLEDSIDNGVPLSNINIRNCIGTVLAINGFRQYYYIYHARSGTHNANTGSDNEQGSNEMVLKPIVEEGPLQGLDNWLVMLFDGKLRKIHVSYWPDINS
ncbi:dnaJ homolog subfamily C member 16-like [Argonauta hians]